MLRSELASMLPIPAPHAHKYSRGKLVACVGSVSYPGAACLATHAAQLAGAGFVEVFTAKSNVSLLQSYRPSLVVRGFEQAHPGSFFTNDYPGAVLIGSGFDTVPSNLMMFNMLKHCLEEVSKPLLIDGGALAWFEYEELRKALLKRSELGYVSVLTPHGGEAQRLAQFANITSSADNSVFAQRLSEAYSSVVVLKGENTIVSSGKHQCEITHGTAVLAKAGTGDVLAGVIASLLAQGIAPFKAAELGVVLHADAGLLAQNDFGIISASAEEVLAKIPYAIKNLSGYGEQ